MEARPLRDPSPRFSGDCPIVIPATPAEHVLLNLGFRHALSVLAQIQSLLYVSPATQDGQSHM
jgi:hypothetical protein